MNAAAQPVDLTAVALDEIRDPATAAAVRALMQEVETLRRQVGHNEASPMETEERLRACLRCTVQEAGLIHELLRRRKASTAQLTVWLQDRTETRCAAIKAANVRRLVNRARQCLAPHDIAIRLRQGAGYWIAAEHKQVLRKLLSVGTEVAPVIPVEPVSPAAARSIARRAVQSPTEAALARFTADTPSGCPVPVLRMMSTGPCSIETLAAGTGYASNIILGAIERLCAAGFAEQGQSFTARRWKLTQKGLLAATQSGALS